MACGCGKKKITTESGINAQNLRSRGATETEIVHEATDGEEFIYAIYNGADYPHYLPSPTGIVSEYGILNYGMGKKGDKVKIHKDELQSQRGQYLYTPVVDEGEQIKMANKGNEGIRGPEFLDQRIFSAEADTNKRLNSEAEKRSKSEARKAAKAEQEAETKEVVEDNDNDLVALAKRSGEAADAQIAEGGQPQTTAANGTGEQATTTTGTAPTDTTSTNATASGESKSGGTNASGKTARSGR